MPSGSSSQSERRKIARFGVDQITHFVLHKNDVGREVCLHWARDVDVLDVVRLNAGVLVTLRGLHAQGISEDDAVEIVMRFVDELPDTTICSRLSGKRNLVDADICRDARKVWKSDPSYTWQAAASHWEKIGFQLSDKTTWDGLQLLIERKPN